MATRIRTLNFLPEVFQTSTNSQFLGATLDQIVDQPNVKKIDGYVGSKFGYGINAKNYYVTEPTKVRTDYQLDPGVVFTKANETTAQDFISYPGILDALKLEGAITENNNRLFESEFYSWDSFTNLDKIINFNQYYWLPEGPERVVVSTETVFNENNYIVTDVANGYNINALGESGSSTNPTLTLLRGGTYTFAVSQPTKFWIQGEPGVTGYSPTQPNIQTRDVFGVTNNGANVGTVIFNVPYKNAQNSDLNIPGNNTVDVVSTIPFSQLNGQPVTGFAGIDGVTSLDGLTVLFYNTGIPDEVGFVSNFFDYTNFDQNNNLVDPITISVTATSASGNKITCNSTANLVAGNAITFTGTAMGGLIPYSTTINNTIYYVKDIVDSTHFTVSLTPNGTTVTLTTDTGSMTGNINQGLLEEGYYTTVAETVYTIKYIGDPSSPVINLVPASTIIPNQKYTATYGTEWIKRSFYQNDFGTIVLIPYISSILDTLYYQDGTSPNKVGIIRLIESNITNGLDVEKDILGKKSFTSSGGVVFTNGLKVTFQGDITPASYKTGEYYVEGVGTSIELIPVQDLVVPEGFTESTFVPWDTIAWDMSNWEGNSYIPVLLDYITIARNSINKNAWSRSNRWFHIDVINATANYNNNPNLITLYATQDAKAKRPIIEFYPNLKLFNSGAVGKNPIDFIDFRTTDAFSLVAGQQNYYPDVATYTGYSASIVGVPVSITGNVTATTSGTNYLTVASTAGYHVNDSIVFTSGIIGGLNVNEVYYVKEIIDGTSFTISNDPDGDEVSVTTGSGTMAYDLTPLSTTITVPNSDVTKKFQTGYFIADSTNQLPRNTIITNVSGTSTITLTVSWTEISTAVSSTSTSSIIATDTTVDNYALFDGARVVFAADTDPNVRNKIYISRLSTISGSSVPVITLTEAEDGDVVYNNQTVAFRGYNYQGEDFWYDGTGWITGQQKITVNQPPLFDIFDENGVSLGNSEVYVGTSFVGNKLFAYGIGSGADDKYLGFPVRYSSVDNVGDISFDVSLNKDTFNYVSGTTPITQKVNTGYVYNYTKTGELIRELGWKTAVGPSVQYQLFSFPFQPAIQDPSFICDIAANLETQWPTIQVYVNNVLQPRDSYTTVVGSTTTLVTLSTAPTVDTVVQVLILSNQVSKNAYYTIPSNLNNNPLNQELTTANVGDIRGQYQSIFYNNPNTTGDVFGPNNYHDLGNLVPWGNKIIQNSASLVLPGAFLRKQNHNLFDALKFNSREYIKFKSLLVDTVNNTAYSQMYDPSYILDDAMDQITLSKTDSQPFFWSDMLPSKAAYVANTYSFANSLDVSIYPLTHVYDFTKANYNGIIVYLTRTTGGITTVTQLLKGQDYTVSADSPSLTVTLYLLPGDQITIKEYNQTYGSYVPNTPTKLGLYPSFLPQVVLDSDYAQPTYFIRGHDGSYNKLYGDYIQETDTLVDFRDQALLEFEKRIYNNLKISAVIPIEEYEVLPGFFRTTDYSYDEWLQIYSTTFLDWVGQNRVNYKNQFFNKNNEYTYNYWQSANRINGQPISQGYWRGVYQYFYDTTTPNITPWEMIGYKDQPSWWTNRYGPAPYTSDNLILWEDMAAGIDWNDGNPIVITQAIRPQLLDILPVDTAGELLSPFDSIVSNYNANILQRDWKVGDSAPTEFSYRRSSSYPFDLMRELALTKPAKFYNLAVDLDNYKYNVEFDQYLVNNRSHLVISDVEIYGNGTAKTSYINWIVDYEKQLGIDATTNITTLLDNLDVRLVYRLAGFSDKTLLKFYVEKGTPNSRNASLLIPDDSYAVLLYDNQPYDKIVYTGVIIQSVTDGYAVYGNSQSSAYFKIANPNVNGKVDEIKIDNLTAKVSVDYSTDVTIVPYGTVFSTPQEVSQFLVSYGAHLTQQGLLFDQIEVGLEINWRQMVSEFLYWAQTGWEDGSIVTLNPAAKEIKIDKENSVVQPLTLQKTNFILNENLYPIQSMDLAVVRDDTLFSAKPVNTGDTVGYGQFNLSNFEHGIVFNNVTLFDDVIYNLVTGLRQNRILLRGTKTADWNGTVTAQGFVLNQDNIIEWSRETKYTKGQIVKYKNKYWAALKVIQASEVFNQNDWKQTDYNNIQKGMLPNASTRSYESTLYYDVNQANLEQDADLLSFSLIGYRPRDYLAIADLTDITQINVYKNLIKNKGTRNATYAFKGATLPQGGIDYEIYENWAIKSGEFGGVLNSNFVEFKLNQNYLTGNPSIVGLTNGEYTDGVQQEVPLYSLFNYGRAVSNPDVLPQITAAEPSLLYPDAGYVNFNDVKLSSYYYSQLPNAVNQNGITVSIKDLYVRDYMWLADYLSTWQIFAPASLGSIIGAKNNLNNTTTITFDKPHNLTQYQPFAIVNFNVAVDGYYIALTIIDAYSVIVNLTLDPNTRTLTGLGVGLQFQSQRVSTPSDIQNLPLLSSEFVKNKVWVDNNDDGYWAVYRKSLNYQYSQEIVRPAGYSFGTSVAVGNQLGYLVGAAEDGKVYRYTYNELAKAYQLTQTLTNGVSYGSSIAYAGDIYAITEPDSDKIYLYQLQSSTLSDDLVTYQSAISSPGDAVAISGDTNWIYAADTTNNIIYVYRKTYLPTNAGFFVPGKTYTISSVGTTDFTVASLGATSNTVGTVFTPSAPGSGTGTAIECNYELATTIDGNSLGLTVSGDKFGYSLSTDYYGDTLIVGTPNKDYSVTIDNWGYTYVFNRAVQNIETQYDILTPQTFPLAWSPASLAKTASATNDVGNTITLNSTSGITLNDPIVFSSGMSGTNIETNYVYYVRSISGNNITLKTSRDSSTAVTVTTASITASASVQTTPIYVSVNGTPVADNNYAIVSGNLVYTTPLGAGDIINVSGQSFTLVQTLTTETTPKVGVHFGNSVDTTTHASEILVGAPFELNTQTEEGAVYRYTNGGGKYGMIIGTGTVNVTTTRNILLNGFLVKLTPGNASTIANIINQAKVTNITAIATTDNKLIISLIDNDLSIPNEKLLLSVVDTATLGELGISIYTQTQIIECPHLYGPTQFGTTLKFNEFDSFVVSAPVGTRYEATTFDFSDDELDNDTVFDNNATQWVDTWANAGAVYMFDYLPNYQETLTNPGKFVYAQPVNARNETFGLQPMYGTALDFNNYQVIVGTPDFRPAYDNGQVVTYTNITGQSDWSVFRNSSAIVDINRINNSQIFSAETNNTLINLDYIDPLQGKILGAARENIDVVSNIDPANYNNVVNEAAGVWGTDHLGKLWLDTSNMRFVNYHQDDVVYNSRYWGTLFPGSDVAVYSWVSSNVIPSLYKGPGTPYDTQKYSTQYVINATGALVPVYYFWARNTNVVFTKTGKTLADSIVESYIKNPNNSGISYFTPILPNVFGLYNCGEYINANDSVFHVGYSTGTNNDVGHNQFSLIRANFADDFLPGIPSVANRSRGTTHGNTLNVSDDLPESLYDRMLDSLCGVDEEGAVVPNPFLPKAVQYGVLARPRQSFFVNRLGALQNYLGYANEVLAQFPISELKQSSFLYRKGTINYSTDPAYNTDPSSPYYSTNPWTGPIELFYDTTDYWEYVNWWATGYNDSTKATLQVPIYADLSTLNVASGTIVTVTTNGNGLSETYIYGTDGTWTRIGLQKGTIKFKSSLWDYSAARIGWGDNFFDTVPYDSYPSAPTRNIIRALNEEIYTDDLLIFRNKSLILMFEYIQSETVESQNYLPWLNKTSFIDVSHKIRELKPIEVFQSDNQEFLSGYLNEVKPYHVVIKEFLFEYTGTDVFEGDITDFDLPAKYNTAIQQFVSPQLVYNNANDVNQYYPSDTIWQTTPYDQWYQNRGLSIAGENNVQITTLASYIALNTTEFAVDNASGLPINGEILIGKEIIGYSNVDRAYNVISGLTRGVNGTPISTHIPGDLIYIDLPAVLLLDGSRGYSNPPKVTAYIDTEKYGEPIRPAVLEAVMNLDSVLRVDVIDPGQGYPVRPEIRIDSALTSTFAETAVNALSSTIRLYAPLLRTGDLIQYKTGADSTAPGGLQENQWYYVNVLETTPLVVVALYTTYWDAVNDNNRVRLFNTGTGANHSLSLGAKASAITSAIPVRENNITLRFDRTTYDSQVIDWRAGNYYGAYYAGRYNNSINFASSSIQLESTQPPIDSILASNQGVAFEITNVANQRTVTYSSLARNVDTIISSVIRLTPLDDGSGNPNASGSTIGFYVGMPIRFSGYVNASGLDVDTVYYVAEIVNDFDFKVSLSETGSPVLALTSTTILAPGLQCYAGEVSDKAILSVNYPGITSVTATKATTNKLTIPTTLIGTGGTNGFYTGLPIFFTGNTFGGVVENDPYYVTTVCDNQTFTMSRTNNPEILTILGTTTGTNVVTVEDNTGTLKANDPIIFTNFSVTGGNFVIGQTYTITNVGTTDFTSIGALYNTVGTTFIATGTGTGTGTASTLTMGGLTAGTTYYVSSLVSNSTFKVASGINTAPLALTTTVGTGYVTSQVDTYSLTNATGSMTVNINLPVSPGQVTGHEFTLYKTSGQFSNISGTNGGLVERDVGATLATVNRVAITYASGGLTNFYVGMPVEVATNIGGLNAGTTYYVTSTGTTDLTVTNTSSSSVVGIVTGSISATSMIVTAVTSGVLIPGAVISGTGITAGTTISEQLTGTAGGVGTYRVSISQSVSSTTINASVGSLTCDTSETLTPTAALYVDMPITFGGQGLGGIDIEVEYYVLSILDDTKFVITNTPGGSAVVLTTQTGIMTVTGSPYVQVSLTEGGGVVSLLDESGIVLMNQTPLTPAVFDVSYILGGYRVVITDPGSGYTIDNTITIPGTSFGGTSPLNDLTLVVNSINEVSIDPVTFELTSDGQITNTICNGTVPGATQKYFLKAISSTEFEVYTNALMTIPVSGLGFTFTGFTTSNVTGTTASTDRVTVDTTGFNINDPVTFTANSTGQSIVGGLIAGKTYYILSLTSTYVTLSTVPGDVASLVNITATSTTANFTMTKAGDYALLPEPFTFNQSIVKYGNQVYICVISNNDSEFILGKWQLLQSSDRRLNALDRIIGYYNPTDNMPGVDLSQLVDGITYPNSTYFGNKFAPAQQYELDTILPNTTFYPTEIDMTAVVYVNGRYFAPMNTASYSGVALSPLTTSLWEIDTVTQTNVNLSDVIYAGGFYIITSQNSATPIFRSNDGLIWTSNGYFTPYGSTPYDELPYDVTSLNVASLYLNSVAYRNNTFVAVGQNIVNSTDTYGWNEVYAFVGPLASNNILYGVEGITSAGFNGFIAVGKGQRYDYSQLLTTVVNQNLIVISTNGTNWTPVDYITYTGLNSVATNGTVIVAVGEEESVFVSTNGTTWTGVTQTQILSADGTADTLNLADTTYLSVGDKLRYQGTSTTFAGLTAGVDYYVKTVNASGITLSDNAGLVGTVNISNGTPAGLAILYIPGLTLVDVCYSATHGMFIAVGNSGLIKTSANGTTWTTQTTDTTENLKGIACNEVTGEITVVGDNNTIIQSNDGGVTWTSISAFSNPEPAYSIQGDTFLSGYGPEELVPGTVTDNVTMIVATRPGTNWAVTEYAHVGYNVVSVELTPQFGIQTQYSFDRVVKTPAQLAVYIINTTGLGTAIYLGNDYSINWITNTITLNSPLSTGQKLRIDVYETGNGDQLVKADTKTDPIRINDSTGWNEIYVNCNYSATIFQGSGVVRQGTNPVQTGVYATEGTTNTILCDEVSGFNLNDPITFQGTTFGGILEDTVYFVKTISPITNTITISLSYNSSTGTAGPTLVLSNDTGFMYAIQQVGSGQPYTDPLIYHNGTKLVHGVTETVTRTNQLRDTITCNTTNGLIVGTPIVFSDTMFGNVIQPQTVYYITSIYDNNEFTISETVGGPTLELTDATGGAEFITNDYAFGIQPNGIQAKIIFASHYDSTVDYLNYTLFGETAPEQYGYTIPETQLFTGNGSTSSFALSNYIAGDNANNAIVEVNGLRLINGSDYTISVLTQTILFNTPPAVGATIAVTTYHLTDRQYFTTQYGITASPGSTSIALTIDTTTHFEATYDQDTPTAISYDQDTPTVVAFDEVLDYLSVASPGTTASLNLNDKIVFSSPTIGGILPDTPYYVTSILNSTDFTVSDTIGGIPVTVTNDSGTMTSVANALTVANITNIDNAITPYLAITQASATSSTGNIITCSSTSGFVVNQTVIFQGITFGDISTGTTVYFVDSILSGTTFTIKDQYGNQIVLTDDTGTMQVFVGGTPAVRVTTGIKHNLITNDVIRIDGVTGSTQLNNNVYYARVIDDYTIDLYEYGVAGNTGYDPAYAAVNYPITTISSYTGGGYVWLDGLFVLSTVTSTATSSSGNTITVSSIDNLVLENPIYFTEGTKQVGETTLGGLVIGTEYYVKAIVNNTQFTISNTRNGDEVILTSNTGIMNVTQWEQDNVDRLWVTVNGYRVPSSKLRLNPANFVSILTTILPGDVVTITSMIPSATPNEEVYLLNVNQVEEALVYRANTQTRTWLTHPLEYIDTTIYVNDVTTLTNKIVQNVTTPASVNNKYNIGLTADKNLITEISVFNNTTNEYIDKTHFEVIIVNLSPILQIDSGVDITVGDQLTVTVLEGDVIYIAGEQIKFGSVDLVNNTLTDLQRGANSTGTQTYIPIYTEVFGLLSENQMSSVGYQQTWNPIPGLFNPTLGDPLQIAETPEAIFLNTDVN